MGPDGGDSTGRGQASEGAAGADAAERRSAFYRLGLFARRRRWIILAVWLLGMVAAVPLLMQLTDRLSNGGFGKPGSQSDRVQRILERDFGRSELTSSLVVHSDEFVAEDEEFAATVEDARAALRKAPGVAVVSDPYDSPSRSISADRQTAIATVELTGTQEDALDNAAALNDAVAGVQADHPGTEVLLAGAAPFYAEFTETTTEDLERAEKIALPITLLILLIAFGTVVAAGMPIALALLSLGVAFGAISALAIATDVSIFTQNIASMIGIGVGIDYSLFIITRYREGLRRGLDVPEAIGEAMESSGKAVFVSGLAVVVALAGTQLVDIQAFRSMGWGAMIAVAFAALAALTLLPALLGVAGRKVNSMRVRRGDTGQSTLWHRWGKAIMRRPWLALAAAGAVLVLMAIPALHLRLGSSGPTILPSDSPPRVASERVAEAFGEGAVAPVQVVLESRADGGGDFSTEGFRSVWDATAFLAAQPEVVRVDSLATLCPPQECPGQTYEQAAGFAASPLSTELKRPLLANGGRTTVLSVVTSGGAQSDSAQGFVKRARRELPEVIGSGAELAVGGDAGLEVDINTEIEDSLIPVVGMVLLLSYLMLMVFFRSLLLPLKAVLMNLASVVAVYGALVFVFQDGQLEGLLGFESAGHIESFLPLFLFCILFGLSMDYEVFLLARMREEYLRTRDNTEAVAWGLERTAWIITSAAAIMVTVFGAFAFATIVPIKSMGFGLALAVLIDATLVRLVLVPAAMRLMGRWNWWLPAWLDRRLPNVSIEGARPAGEAEKVPEPV